MSKLGKHEANNKKRRNDYGRLSKSSGATNTVKRIYSAYSHTGENSMKVLDTTHEQELVSVKTLSERLDIPQKTIRKWVYKRSIPFYKVGQKLVRFDIREVRDWYVGSASKPQQSFVAERAF